MSFCRHAALILSEAEFGPSPQPRCVGTVQHLPGVGIVDVLAHQNRRIAIASDFDVDRWAESKVHSFCGVMAFLQHGPKKLSASKMEGFPRNSGEIAQIVSGQNVGSMHVKRSDPEKD